MNKRKLTTLVLISVLLLSTYAYLFKIVPFPLVYADNSVIHPNAFGSNTNLFPSGAVDGWDCVNEADPNDADTTYVYSSLEDSEPIVDTYNSADGQVPSNALISNVDFYMVSRSTSNTYKASFRMAILTSTLYYNSTQQPTTTYTSYLSSYSKNPNGSDWTVTAIDAMEFGVEIASGVHGASFYIGRCTQVEANVTYTSTATSTPQYSSVSVNTTQPFNNTAIEFRTYWTSATGNLSKAWLSTNKTGSFTDEAATAFSATNESWANLTITVTVSVESMVQMKMYANNTDANQNVTNTINIFYWTTLPPISDKLFGNSIGGSLNGVYYKGARDWIFVPYQDSTTSPYWTMKIRAYDMNASSWSDAYTVASAPPQASMTRWNDWHMRPALIIPQSGALAGHLCYFYGDNSPLYYNVSTYSAATTSNINTLLSSWTTAKQIGITSDLFAYPNPLSFPTVTQLFYRNATVSDLSYMASYRTGEAAYFYCNANTTTFKQWTYVGSQPYLDDGDTSYISVNGAGLRSGNYSFPDFTAWYSPYDSFKTAYVEFYCTAIGSSRKMTVYINNGTTLIYTQTAMSVAAGWNSIALPASMNNSASINNLNIAFMLSTGGSGAVNISRARISITYDGWSCQQFSGTQYGWATKAEDNILYCAFTKDDANFTVSENQFSAVYSFDKGATWAQINSSATHLTLPINMSQQIVSSDLPYKYGATSGIMLDENNYPMTLIWHTSNQTYQQDVYSSGNPFEILYYNATLGNAGTWIRANMTDENGDSITGAMITKNLWVNKDPFYLRPSLWINLNGTMRKYVRIPQNFTAWRCIWESEDTSYKTQFISVGVLDAPDNTPQCYEVIANEWHVTALGNVTVQSTWFTPTSNEFWLTKYTATENCTIDGGEVFANETYGGGNNWQQAIFDDPWQNGTLRLLVASDQDILSGGMTAGTTYNWGWLTECAYTNRTTIVNGSDYWIAYRFNNNETSLVYDASSTVNQTASYSLNWDSDFPSTITPTTFYNRTVSVCSFPSFLKVKGLGVDDFATSFSALGTNTTEVGAACQAFVYVSDLSVLSKWAFSTNNTGINVTSSFYDFGSVVEAWARYNFTLNSTTGNMVQFRFAANDSYNNFAYSEYYNITLGRDLLLDVIENLQTIWSMYEVLERGFGHVVEVTMFTVNPYSMERLYGIPNLLSPSSLLFGLKELFIATSETASLTANLFSGLERFFSDAVQMVLGSVFGFSMEKLFVNIDLVQIADAWFSQSETLIQNVEKSFTDLITLASNFLMNKELGYPTTETSTGNWAVQQIKEMQTGTAELSTLITVTTSATETFLGIFTFIETLTITGTFFKLIESVTIQEINWKVLFLAVFMAMGLLGVMLVIRRQRVQKET